MSHTERLGIDGIGRAAEILIQGGIVAFPTETVFGLGGLATREESVQRIFQAKGRPSDNPLIVHVADTEQAMACVSHMPEIAIRLWEKFAPGPLTLILPKHRSLARSVTAGLDTVGVRIPSHPWALQLLQLVKQPIAAPSANRSGRPSGTTWQSVLEDLDGSIDAILCGPEANVGLESTVLDLCQDPPRILRAGAIRREDLLPLLPNLADDQQPSMDPSLDRRSPGTRHPHYQPQAEVVLVNCLAEALELDLVRARMPGSQGCGQIAFLGMATVEPASDFPSSSFRLAHQCATLEEYASKLFEFLREADRRGCRTIYCQRVEEQGLGVALMDRLRRASES